MAAANSQNAMADIHQNMIDFFFFFRRSAEWRGNEIDYLKQAAPRVDENGREQMGKSKGGRRADRPEKTKNSGRWRRARDYTHWTPFRRLGSVHLQPSRQYFSTKVENKWERLWRVPI